MARAVFLKIINTFEKQSEKVRQIKEKKRDFFLPSDSFLECTQQLELGPAVARTLELPLGPQQGATFMRLHQPLLSRTCITGTMNWKQKQDWIPSVPI